MAKKLELSSFLKALFFYPKSCFKKYFLNTQIFFLAYKLFEKLKSYFQKLSQTPTKSYNMCKTWFCFILLVNIIFLLNNIIYFYCSCPLEKYWLIMEWEPHNIFLLTNLFLVLSLISCFMIKLKIKRSNL